MNKLEELKSLDCAYKIAAERAVLKPHDALLMFCAEKAEHEFFLAVNELLPDLIAVAEAAKNLRTSHRASMESPSFHNQSVYEGAQILMDYALLPLNKETDK